MPPVAAFISCIHSISVLSTYTGIDQYGSLIDIQRERTDIVMIMALVVMSSFTGKEKSATGSHITKLGLGIPRGSWG